jgi:cytochrome bd-type quinol oxidase subunit 2
MKKVLILSSLLVVVCVAVVSITIAKRNASMLFQVENMEALSLGGSIIIETCYMNVSEVSGTGIYFIKCSVGTTIINGEYVIYPCNHESTMRVESSQSYVSNANRCYAVPSPD